jgi:hypothetical protein
MSLPFLHMRPRERPHETVLACSELVDEAMERYVEWREECLAVEHAYANWASSPSDTAELPFAAYSAALDREQSAATVYRRAIERLAKSL